MPITKRRVPRVLFCRIIGVPLNPTDRSHDGFG